MNAETSAPLIFVFIALGSLLIGAVVVGLLKKVFPCAGDWLHPDLTMLDGEICECRRCGKRWRLIGKHYSIASSDEDGYIPEWEELT